MFPASNRGAGACTGMPDVCNTPTPGGPPAPVPYPNIGLNAQATGFAPSVKVSNMNALNIGSLIPMTSGDEAGTAHPTVKGPARYTLGSPIVKIVKLAAVRLTSPSTNNDMNAQGAVLVPSAVNVHVARAEPCAGRDDSPVSMGDPYARAVGRDDLLALRDVVHGASADGPLQTTMLEKGVGHVRIRRFSSDLPARLHAAMGRPEMKGARSLVLDLRGNPGGDVSAFLAVAEDFLPAGSVLVRSIDVDGDEVIRRSHGEQVYEVPLVVLMDHGTASAAELLAGCLQAHGRAALVGETSYGKGCAQKVVPSSTGEGAFYATVMSYRLPDGRDIEGVGVRPDVEVPASSGGDSQIEAALEIACRRGGTPWIP